MHKIVLLMVFVMGSSGCAKLLERESRGFTEVSFRGGATNSMNLMDYFNSPQDAVDSASILAGPLSGGLVIFAQSSISPGITGRKMLTDETANSTWVIPNSSYRFYVMGNMTAGLAGAFKCGVANAGSPIALTGAAIAIPITVDPTQCSAPPFAPAATATTALTVLFCTPATILSSITALANTCATGGGTQGSTYSSINLGVFSGDEFAGPLLQTVAGAASGMMSGPVNFTTAAGLFSTGLPALLPGDPGSAGTMRIKSELVAFTGSGGTGASDLFQFEVGLSGPDGVSGFPPHRITKNGIDISTSAKFIRSASSVKLFINN